MAEPGAVTGHTAIYRVVGDLDFATTPGVFRAVDRLACVPGLRTLVLDLGGTQAMDSSGLAVLVQAHNRSRQRGFRLVLRNIPPRVAYLLSLTGLDTVLDVTGSAPPTGPDLRPGAARPNGSE